jgi:hypothetical protein
MTPRIFCLSVSLLLAGCSSLPSMHSLLTFDADDAPASVAAAQPAAAPAPVAAQPDNWCNSVAANRRAAAAAHGFDAASQDRMMRNTLRQCVAMTRD